MPIADDPGRVRETDFPHDASKREQLKFLLNFAVLAPSVCDSQPWIFRVAGEAVELYADRSRGLQAVDPRGRQVVMSCGSALLNLRVAIEYFGAEATVKTFPQMDLPDLLASVRMGSAKTPSSYVRRLFRSISAPPTERNKGFTSRAALRAVEEAVGMEGALFDLLHEEDPRHRRLLVLLETARHARDASLPRETESPVAEAPNARLPVHPWNAGAGDGLPAPDAFVSAGMMPENAEGLRHAAERGIAALTAVISTRADNPFEWLKAGQAFARMSLVARELDLRVSLLNNAAESSRFADQFRRSVGADRVPQVVFQISAGNSGGPASRRPLHDMLSVF